MLILIEQSLLAGLPSMADIGATANAAGNSNQTNAPRYSAPPKPDPRERSLTPPIPSPGHNTPPARDSGTIPPVNFQNSSPLFSVLPAEIRFQIWCEILADQVINLFLEPRPPYALKLCSCTISPECDMRLAQSIGGWIGLLQSCRRIYTEIIDLIYEGNTFYAHNEFTLAYLSRKIPAARFASIRSIHLKTFCPSPRHTHVAGYGELDPAMEVWNVLASMPRLERLTVEIGGREWMGRDTKWWDGTDVRSWQANEAFFMQRMDVIKQVREFRVLVSWPQGIHPMDVVVPLCKIERRWPPAVFWDYPRAVD